MIVANPDVAAGLGGRRAVFFDFDGTLADTVGGIRACARDTLLAFGLTEREVGDVNRIIGPAFPGAFVEVYGMSEQDAREVTRLYRERYRTLGPETRAPYAGIPELLARLSADGRLLAITTCKLRELAASQAEEHGYLGLFDRVVGKDDDTPVTKAELVARSLDLLAVGPDEAVMVGDRRNDMEGARAAGVAAVGVAYGAGTADELLCAGADVVVDSVEELGRVLTDGASG